MFLNRLINKNLLIFLLLIFVSFSIVKFKYVSFKKEDISHFGYTPKYISIADNSIKYKNYVDDYSYYTELLKRSKEYQTLVPRNFILPETQREPLYPLILMLTRLTTHNYYNIIYLQVFLLILVLAIWGYFFLKIGKLFEVILFYAVLSFSIIPYFYSSVFYPYTFQFFFLSLSFCLLYVGIKTENKKYLILLSICLALAIYERGSLLFLPLFIFFSLIFSQFLFKYKIKRIVLLSLLLSYVFISPWLIRNFYLKVYGMNQMIGYTLGYTYGQLIDGSTDSSSKEYSNYIKNFKGTDSGTMAYVIDNTLKGNGSFEENDKKVAKIIISKIKNNPKETLVIIRNNILYYPVKLIGYNSSEVFNKAGDYYFKIVQGIHPSLFDYVIFIFSILGATLGTLRRNFISLLSGIYIFYFMFFSTTIVLFDSRYRSMTDLLIYWNFIDFTINYILLFFKRLFSNKIQIFKFAK